MTIDKVVDSPAAAVRDVAPGGAVGISGATDRPGRLVIALRHRERSGRPKLVGRCEHPVPVTGCVDPVVTAVAALERDARGLVRRGNLTPAGVRAPAGVPPTVELWADAGEGVEACPAR